MRAVSGNRCAEPARAHELDHARVVAARSRSPAPRARSRAASTSESGSVPQRSSASAQPATKPGVRDRERADQRRAFGTPGRRNMSRVAAAGAVSRASIAMHLAEPGADQHERAAAEPGRERLRHGERERRRDRGVDRVAAALEHRAARARRLRLRTPPPCRACRYAGAGDAARPTRRARAERVRAGVRVRRRSKFAQRAEGERRRSMAASYHAIGRSERARRIAGLSCRPRGPVAQLVEHRTENAGVASSTLAWATTVIPRTTRSRRHPHVRLDQRPSGLDRARDAHRARDRAGHRQHRLHLDPVGQAAARAAARGRASSGSRSRCSGASRCCSRSRGSCGSPTDLFKVVGQGFSGRDLILLAGGLFLIGEEHLRDPRQDGGRQRTAARSAPRRLVRLRDLPDPAARPRVLARLRDHGGRHGRRRARDGRWPW